MSNTPTGRRPSRPVFQDLNWGRSTRKEPGNPTPSVDYASIEGRYHRMTLDQMESQFRSVQLAMRALMENLPPGAVVYQDEVDLTGVAPEDLRSYEKRMVEWLERHSRREDRNAGTEALRRGGPDPEV